VFNAIRPIDSIERVYSERGDEVERFLREFDFY